MSFKFYGDPNMNEDGFSIVPEGKHILEIVETEEKTSANGDPQVIVTLEDEQNNTMRHFVTFLPVGNKGHGIGKHWLKCLNVPYDGDIEVEPEDWKGRMIKVDVFHQRNDKGRTFANIDISTIEAAGTVSGSAVEREKFFKIPVKNGENNPFA